MYNIQSYYWYMLCVVLVIELLLLIKFQSEISIVLSIVCMALHSWDKNPESKILCSPKN